CSEATPPALSSHRALNSGGIMRSRSAPPCRATAGSGWSEGAAPAAASAAASAATAPCPTHSPASNPRIHAILLNMMRSFGFVHGTEYGDLRDWSALMKRRLVPIAGIEDVFQDFDGIPYVGKAQIQGRDAEAQQIGLAVVADHPARDQGLHH